MNIFDLDPRTLKHFISYRIFLKQTTVVEKKIVLSNNTEKSNYNKLLINCLRLLDQSLSLIDLLIIKLTIKLNFEKTNYEILQLISRHWFFTNNVLHNTNIGITININFLLSCSLVP